MQDKNVTYLHLLDDVQTLETKLFTLQKEHDTRFPSLDLPTDNKSVDFVEDKINNDINKESCKLLEIDSLQFWCYVDDVLLLIDPLQRIDL